MKKEQLDKLPKWAQMEIKRLMNDLNSAQSDLSDMFSKEPSNIQYLYLLEKKNLPNNAQIRFNLNDDHYVEISIVDNQIRIYGDRALSVLPRASNSIYLKVIPF